VAVDHAAQAAVGVELKRLGDAACGGCIEAVHQELGASVPLVFGVSEGASIVGKHMAWPFHCWPHQQRPSASMMQVPVPQQRSSSCMGMESLKQWVGMPMAP